MLVLIGPPPRICMTECTFYDIGVPGTPITRHACVKLTSQSRWLTSTPTLLIDTDFHNFGRVRQRDVRRVIHMWQEI